MDSKQIDTAMREKTPVTCDGMRYKRIIDFISWYDNTGKHRLSVVMLEMNGRNTVRVPAERVELIKEDDNV